MSIKFDNHLSFAKRTAIKAGELLVKKRGKNTIRVLKGQLVTQTDKESDKFIRKNIISRFPKDTIISEENKLKKGNEYEWIFDPLDGTNNYCRDNPLFSVAVGLKYKGETVMGVVFAPLLKELFYAVKGRGSFLEKNNKKYRLHVSGIISKKMFNISFAASIDYRDQKKHDQMIRKLRKLKILKNFRRRMIQSTALDLCYIAAGRLDAYYTNEPKLWDVTAGEIIVKEAKGKFTYIGPQKGIMASKTVLASNGVIHQPLLNIIN